MASNRTRTGGRRGGGLLATINPREERFCVDLAVGQGLLQVVDACVGDLGIAEAEAFQLGHFLEVHETHVGDLGAEATEPLQVSQSFEMYQPGVM